MWRGGGAVGSGKGRAHGPSGVLSEMIATSGGVGILVTVEICQ